MLGQILILHNSQNLSSLSTSSQLSNKKRLIALIGSVNENVAHYFLCTCTCKPDMESYELYLYSNFRVAWKANIFKNIYSIIKIARIPRSFSNSQGQPWKRQGWRSWCCKHRNSAFDWHNEVRKQCFGEVSKHCNYFWLTSLTGCSLNIQEITILTFTITR